MPTDEPADAAGDVMAKVYQLPKRQPRPAPCLSPARSPSFEEVVNACLDTFTAGDDLVALVFDTMVVDAYEDWVDRAFRDAITAIAARHPRWSSSPDAGHPTIE